MNFKTATFNNEKDASAENSPYKNLFLCQPFKESKSNNHKNNIKIVNNLNKNELDFDEKQSLRKNFL